MENLLFSQLQLSPQAERALQDMGYEESTEIQTRAIPLIRTGVDVIGRSQTGTGKTIAFAVTAIEAIDTTIQKMPLQVMILCPTRELAQQAHKEIQKLTKFQNEVHSVAVYGGDSMEKQIAQLRKAHIVIGTPGRIMDHLRRRTIKLDYLKMVVLDEADEMLSMGFKEDIETILQTAPEERQTILFSATMPPAIMELTKEFLKDPMMIEVNKAQVTLDNIEQCYLEVPSNRKMDALRLLLSYYEPNRAIMFCNTKHMVDELTTMLEENGFRAEGLHGDMKQSQRTSTMDAFKSGRVPLLIATDVAARGIDVNDIDYVINYDIPQNSEYYIHRIGRTGRIGKKGVAITICGSRRQARGMIELADVVKSDIKEIPIPSAKTINDMKVTKQKEMIEAELGMKPDGRYVRMLEKLMAEGHSAESIAVAALKLRFGAEDVVIPSIIVEKKREERSRGKSGNKNAEYRKSDAAKSRSAKSDYRGDKTSESGKTHQKQAQKKQKSALKFQPNESKKFKSSGRTSASSDFQQSKFGGRHSKPQWEHDDNAYFRKKSKKQGFKKSYSK